MTASPPGETAASGARLATRMTFLATGVVNSAWAPMVPFAKFRSGLDTASFGVVLIGLGVGAVLAMPAISWMLRRLGSRRSIIASCLLLTVILPALAVIASPLGLAVALLAFGFGLGGLDAAMNAQAVEVAIRSGRPMMSGFHGMYSLGGLVGALAVSLMLLAGLSVLGAALLAATVFTLIWALSARLLLPGLEVRPAAGGRPGWRLALRPLLVVLSLLTFIGYLAEGAVLDWSALFLHLKGAPTSMGGIGYAAFSIAMAVARLTGDGLTRRLGAVAVLRLSAAVAILGWAVAIFLPTYWSVAGFALIGAGSGNIVPLLLASTARIRGVPTSLSIPLVGGVGYAGILSGPALVGLAAGATNLATALAGVGVLLFAVLFSARIARH